MANFVRYFLAGIGVVVLLLTGALILGLYTLPVGRVAQVDFASLTLTSKPNQYLVCPRELCAAAPDRESPTFDLTTEQLRTQWLVWAAGQNGLEPLSEHPDGLQLDVVERTKLIGFPDVITVRFVSVDGGKSSIAIYSRSVYGYSDLGVNRDRIERWLSDFESWQAG